MVLFLQEDKSRHPGRDNHEITSSCNLHFYIEKTVHKI